MNLIQGDCLEKMKDIPDKSVDFVFLDLPFGQTACKWDIKLDLDLLWIQLKRIAKNDRTPFFFSCTTKFGFELIKANEKWFRWDLVWKKNRAAGFLNAYKLPMRKHEMVYCFAKKSPEYDVSSHKEYVEEKKTRGESEMKVDLYHNNNVGVKSKTHKDPLPTSDITPPTPEHELVYCFAKKSPEYDVSSHKTGETTTGTSKGHVYLKEFQSRGQDESYFDKNHTKQVLSEPLPTSDITPPTPEHELVYCFAKKSPEYDVSSHKEYYEQTVYQKKTGIYGDKNEQVLSKVHKDPLPTSDITPPTPEHELVYCFAKKSPEYDVSSHKEYELDKRVEHKGGEVYGIEPGKVKIDIKKHKDPLPTSDITPPTPEHELVYCFAKKSPEYDVSSHKEYVEDQRQDGIQPDLYGEYPIVNRKTHKDRLPTSDITPPTPEHELVYCFAKKLPEYDVSSHITGDEVVKPSCKEHISMIEMTGGRKCMMIPHKSKVLSEPLPTSDITQPDTFDLDDEPSSWCEFKSDEKTGHRTAKPVALMEFLLKYWTKPDATVLDPTMGSGSMGIACKNMGRKFIGIEMDKDIYDLAVKRIG